MFDTKAYEEKMKKSIEALHNNLNTIRAGKAYPEVLARVTVDYYGSPTPISQMAAVTTPDPRTLVISPWDASTVKNIEKAILASDLGLTPANDGKVIRLAFPQPTEERRKELVKTASKICEEAKVAIRNVRREANDNIKEMKKNSEMTEDEAKQGDKLVQDLTDKYVKEIDIVAADKNKEIMAI